MLSTLEISILEGFATINTAILDDHFSRETTCLQMVLITTSLIYIYIYFVTPYKTTPFPLTQRHQYVNIHNCVIEITVLIPFPYVLSRV